MVRFAEHVGSLAAPAVTVPATMTARQLASVFRLRAEASAAVVRDGDRFGIVPRAHLGEAYSDVEPVGDAAAWDVLRVAWDTSLATTAQLVLADPAADRHDDLLVELPDGEIGILPISKLFGELAERAARPGRSGRLDDDASSHEAADITIDTGQLRVYYQPIMSTRDGSIVSAEALVRWQHPTQGLLTPDRFMPAFAREGSLPTLDRWVLGQACQDLAALRTKLGPQAPQWINVNLSRASLRTDFDAMIGDTLAATGLAPDRLRMELPEDADLPALVEVANRLTRLGADGVRFTLDDMGTGATNLRYMSTLPIHGLKIDRMFVAGMADSHRDRTIVELLADLGQRLDIRVTAEGVEHPRQLAMLAELGVAYVQGYHISQPLPRHELAEFLKRQPVPQPA